MSDMIQTLVVARGLLAGGYGKFCLARDPDGNRVAPTDAEAVTFCARGALLRAMGDEIDGLVRLGGDAVARVPLLYVEHQRGQLYTELCRDLPPGYYTGKNDVVDVVFFNNETSREDVLALFDRTIARLRADRGVRALQALRDARWVDFPATEDA